MQKFLQTSRKPWTVTFTDVYEKVGADLRGFEVSEPPQIRTLVDSENVHIPKTFKGDLS